MERKNKAYYGHNKRTNVLPFRKRNNKEQPKEVNAWEVQEQSKQVDEYERYREKDRRSKKLIVKIIVFTAAFTYVCEKHLYKLLDCISWESLILSLPAYVILFIDVIISAVKNDNYSNYDRNDFYERVISAYKSIKDAWHSKPVIEVFVIFLTVGIIVVFGSKYQIYARAEHAVREFFEYDKETDTKSKNYQDATWDLETSISTFTDEEKVNNITEDFAVEDSPYIFTEEEIIKRFGSENYLTARNIIVTEYDRNREENLSESDYNDTFLLEGEFKVDDWSNQEDINKVVSQMIQYECGLQKKNKFDENEDTDDDVLIKLKDEVSAASIREEGEHTFSERIEIIETRKRAYVQYPKGSLAKLLSNDNQALALALVLSGGKKQTEMYYYGKSIIWGREYICFAEVSPESVKAKLNWIAGRYKDIQFICSEEDPEYEYAGKLAIAYQYAADNFE